MLKNNPGGLQTPRQGWIEKRRQERVETTIRVRYVVHDQKSADVLLALDAYKDTHLDQVAGSAQGNRMMEGFTRNLSEGGLFLASDGKILEGQYVLLELILPSSQTKLVRVLAKALQPEGEADKNAMVHRTAIQIIAIHSDDIKALQNYIMTVLYPGN